MGIDTTFLYFKYNELQIDFAPSPAGEGWGEEIKFTLYAPLIPTFSLKGEGASAYVDSYTTKSQPFYY